MPKYSYGIFVISVAITIVHSELIFVNVFFRHGDRTPNGQYPLDPYNNQSIWQNKLGQLTNIGKRQEFELGRWLRNRYSNYLPNNYDPDDIYIESTDIDRALMSAESNLAGLYTPVDKDVWNSNIPWQPIPVHISSENKIPPHKSNCKKHEELLHELISSALFEKLNKTLHPIYDYLTENVGFLVKNLHDLNQIRDVLFIEDLYGLELPPWTKRVFPDTLITWSVFHRQLACFTTQMQRLMVGLLLDEVLERFEDKINGTLRPDRKIWVYSVHDILIINILMSFNAFNQLFPPYASALIMELNKNEDQYYVSVYYKNETTSYHPISILGCDPHCPLTKVQELLKPILLKPNEWKTECESR